MSAKHSFKPVAARANSTLASVLSNLLDAVGGVHHRSYQRGFEEAQQEVAVKAATIPGGTGPQEILIRLVDAREEVAAGVSYDRILLDDAKLDITPAIGRAFKADALVKLGEDHQPTEEQWAAILSPSTSAVTIGVAGTGKTFVMIMRALFMCRYLEIPLEDLTVLAVNKDCRLEVIGQLSDLFLKWGIELTQEQCFDLVKTPRGALLNIIRSIAPLRDVVPFELMGIIDRDEDGRPFDPRLTTEQLEVVESAYQSAYRSNQGFADAIKSLFASAVCLPKPYPTTAAFERLSEGGLELNDADEDITRAVTALWESLGHWPVEGIEPSARTFYVMGYKVYANGYVPEIDAIVVLGYRNTMDRAHTRPGADYCLYEESISKRAFLQRYSTARIIWLDSPEQIASLVENIEKLGIRAPAFDWLTKGEERSLPVAEALYQTGTLIETLGLHPSKAIAQLKFMPNDPDAEFFECASRFWPLFETHLLNLKPRMFTTNRLFQLFGLQGNQHLKAVPVEALRRMRNVLTDELQDITVHTGEFIRACIAENRYRIEVDGIRGAVMSVFACGDDFQTAHGTQGATPKYLTDFKRHFSSRNFKRNLLGVNFRSQQGIILSAHSLITGIPAVSMLAPASVAQAGDANPVEVYDLSARRFMTLFDLHYAEGDSILILAANPDDYKRSEEYVNVVVARDRIENHKARRVRVRAAQRSKGLEADVVLILGDFVASTSTWAKNQIFKSAKTVATQDQSPFDVIQQNELYRLAHIGITRARKKCYWLITPELMEKPRLRASIRISEEYGSFIDRR